MFTISNVRRQAHRKKDVHHKRCNALLLIRYSNLYTKQFVIVPDEPEDPYYYLGARINILSWRLVDQNVDL